MVLGGPDDVSSSQVVQRIRARRLPLSLRKTNLARLLARHPFVAPFEQGEIGPDLFRAACGMGLEDSPRNAATGPIRAAGRSIGSR
jgi:hypothetical protein